MLFTNLRINIFVLHPQNFWTTIAHIYDDKFVFFWVIIVQSIVPNRNFYQTTLAVHDIFSIFARKASFVFKICRIQKFYHIQKCGQFSYFSWNKEWRILICAARIFFVVNKNFRRKFVIHLGTIHTIFFFKNDFYFQIL